MKKFIILAAIAMAVIACGDRNQKTTTYLGEKLYLLTDTTGKYLYLPENERYYKIDTFYVDPTGNYIWAKDACDGLEHIYNFNLKVIVGGEEAKEIWIFLDDSNQIFFITEQAYYSGKKYYRMWNSRGFAYSPDVPNDTFTYFMQNSTPLTAPNCRKISKKDAKKYIPQRIDSPFGFMEVSEKFDRDYSRYAY